MLSSHENKIIVYRRKTLWIHTGKGFGIPAYNGSKKYYSLIKVSIDSKTLEMFLGNLKSQTQPNPNPSLQKSHPKTTEKAKQDYLGWKSTIC